MLSYKQPQRRRRAAYLEFRVAEDIVAGGREVMTTMASASARIRPEVG
jgi:hypothetical protein